MASAGKDVSAAGMEHSSKSEERLDKHSQNQANLIFLNGFGLY